MKDQREGRKFQVEIGLVREYEPEDVSGEGRQKWTRRPGVILHESSISKTVFRQRDLRVSKNNEMTLVGQ